MVGIFFFKQKTAYEMRISDWSSDVCSSDLGEATTSCRTYASRGAGSVPLQVVPLQGIVEVIDQGEQQMMTTPLVDRPSLNPRERTVAVAFGIWMVVGLFLDGWAHDNNKPESFFTPWHGVLYSGFAAATLAAVRSEEHTSELQSLMRISYAVFCLKKK